MVYVCTCPFMYGTFEQEKGSESEFLCRDGEVGSATTVLVAVTGFLISAVADGRSAEYLGKYSLRLQ